MLRLLLLLVSIGLFAVSAAWSEDAGTRISEISISGNSHTRDGLIRCLLYVEEGKRYPARELEDLIRLSAERLRNSFYFYQADVVSVPLENGEAKILVDVMEGFLWRIGGSENGPALGYDNLFGHGERVLFDAGWLYQAARIDLPYLGYSRFNLSLSGYHGSPALWRWQRPVPPAPDTSVTTLYRYKREDWRASLSPAYAFTPGLTAGLVFTAQEFHRDPPGSPPAWAKRAWARNGFFSGAFVDFQRIDDVLYPHRGLRAGFTLDGLPDYAAGKASLSGFLPLGAGWSTFHRVILAASAGAVPWESQTDLELRGKGFARSGASGYALKQEARWRTPPFGWFGSYAEAYGFADYGRAFDSRYPRAETGELIEGPGIRVILAYPILVVADLGLAVHGSEASIAFTTTFAY